MSKQALVGNGLMVIATGCGLILGEACAAATVTGSSSNAAYTVSSTDLLQSDLRSVESTLTLYSESSFVNGALETLTDGSAAINSGDRRMDSYALTGGSVIYTLNTALHPSGYNITSISTYSGWQDNGRDNQNYEVSFRMVGSATFGNAITGSYTGTISQTCVNIVDINLPGVEAIRFAFLSQENGGVGYKELDVFGTASSNIYTVTGTSSNGAYTVSADDVLQTALSATASNLKYYTATGFTNAPAAALTDGSFGSAGKAEGTCCITNGSITYMLDTVSAPAGYLISEINTYSGWDDATRDDQRYTVSFLKVGASRFSDFLSISYTGTVGQACVSITNLSIAHVEAIRFAFSDQENSGAGYKELDVIGTPSAYTNVARLASESQTIISNAAANVRIIEGEGTPQTLALGSALTVIDTLTHSATGGVTMIDPAGQTLAINNLLTQPAAAGLTIGTGSNNGKLASVGASLYIATAGTNEVTIHASITNGSFASSLIKSGTGILTLDSPNTYSGDTAVNGGSLRLTGSGSLSSGALRVNDGKLQLNGGTAYSKREVIFTNAVIEQTAGLLRSDNNILAQNSTLDLSGGTSYVALDTYLGWRGTNTIITLSGSHTANWRNVRFEAGTVTMNLQTGGVLYASRITSVNAAGTLRFDGGILGVSAQDLTLATNTWATVSAGTMSLYVKDGGAVLDTTYGSAVLRLPLLREGTSSGGMTKTGANTLTLASPCFYAGDTLVAAGTLKLQPLSLFVNWGFEQPVYGAGSFSYLASDGVYGGWTMSNNSRAGIARNGSSWVITAPEGMQVGFLQMGSYIKQVIEVPKDGTYQLSFSAASRPNFQGGDRVEFKIDGATVAAWETNAFNNSGLFNTFSTNLSFTAGQHEVSFVGSTPDGADRATAIDNVQLIGTENPPLPGALPKTTRLTIATGATLNLNGAYQTLAELNGGGQIVNTTTTNVILTVGNNNASTIFAGSITGAVSLVKTGTGTLTLSGLNTYSNKTVIQAGAVRLLAPLTAFVNAGFEQPVMGDTGWSYLQSDGVSGGWTMSASWAGIARDDYPKGYSWTRNVPEGTQASFLQKTANIKQTVAIPNTGLYRLSFRAANRPGNGADRVELKIDNTTVVTWETNDFNNSGAFLNYTTNLTLTAGNREFNFAGSSPDGADRATTIDDVRLVWAAAFLPSTLPKQTDLEIADGATLDLNGTLQTLSGLSGGGTITNGSVVITGTIAPGGTNVIGTLTLPGSTSLNGILLIDTALSGSCDLLQVQGNLDLAGLTLQIQNLSLLESSSPYLIATCAPGGLIGRFVSTNLGSKRAVCYDNASGRVLLVGRGSLISLR